jgi:1-acyl-sn-glycerol-3-phosphate acyltransferase
MGRFSYQPGDKDDLDRFRPEEAEWVLKACTLFERYFRYEVRGLENIPEGPAVVVMPHSTVTMDGFLLCKAIYDRYRRVTRGMADHSLFEIPLVRRLCVHMGVVDGTPQNAQGLLERGELIFVMPGGAREAWRSSAQRYQLLWEGHEGFIRVALRGGAPVVPAVCIGADDALWMPFHSLEWGERILGRRWPIFGGVGLGLLPIPLPVKMTTYVGPPIHFGEPPEAADDPKVVRRCHQQVVEAVEGMIARGLRARSSLWT